MKYKTFGNFLGNIMKKRNLSASRLAELTGNKSKTTVIRLLNDDCGSRAIMKFAEVLPEALELDEHEIEEMRHVLNTDLVLPIEKKVTENLLKMFRTQDIYFSKSICTAYNSEKISRKMSFSNVFQSCIGKNSVIIIEGVVSTELAAVLNDVIHRTTKEGFSPVINHFFKADDGMEAKSIQLMSIMKLSTYLGYNAFECRRSCLLGKSITILTENDGGYNMCRVKFTDKDRFHFADTEITEILYRHIIYEQDILIENSLPLRSEPLKRDNLEPMLRDLQEYDKYPTLQINASVSYMMIPFKIQCRLFEECNYIGLGKEHPYIQSLYKILESRADYLRKSGVKRKVIWTREGINSFLKTGKAGDHFRPFTNLTRGEAAETIMSYMDIDGISCRLLKGDYAVFDTEFIIYENAKMLVYDPIWGWWENFTSADIRDRRMLRLATDFYNNELWEKCCYDEDESRKIILDMIENDA